MRPVANSQWVDEDCMSTCSQCNGFIWPGILTSNKHHCRYCGQIVCSQLLCSQIISYNNLSLRTCKTCYQHQLIFDKQQCMIHNKILKEYFIFSDELLLNGYFRDIINLNNKYVPNDIIYFLILWIGNICNERWDKINTDSNIIISNSQQRIQVIHGMDDIFYSGFGANIIKKGMIKTWQFKIKQINNNYSRNPMILIGIVEIDDIIKFKRQSITNYVLEDNMDFIGYTLDLNKGYIRNNNIGKKNLLFGVEKEMRGNQEWNDNFLNNDIGINIGSDDIITMTLDLTSNGKTGELSYEIIRKYDEDRSGIAFHPEIQKKYVLAVKLANDEQLILMHHIMDKYHNNDDWMLVHTQNTD